MPELSRIDKIIKFKETGDPQYKVDPQSRLEKALLTLGVDHATHVDLSYVKTDIQKVADDLASSNKKIADLQQHALLDNVQTS